MSLSKEDIRQELTAIFQSVFEDGSLIANDELQAKDVAKWDSLTNIIMVDEVEKRFNIKFSLREVMKMRHVGDLIAAIQQHL